jgi:glycosyltransferase involved in cell wall biosynthesis
MRQVKRVGLGVTVWAQGIQKNHLDGIGVYTRSLWRALSQIANGENYDLQPYAFGNEFPTLECGVPKPISRKFTWHLAKSLASGHKSSYNFEQNNLLDLFHATDHHIPRLNKTPVVATVMDVIPFIHPEWVSSDFRRIKNFLFKKTILWADHIITISDYSRNDLLNNFNFPEEKITVTPLGVDPIYFEHIPEENLNEVLRQYQLIEGYFLFIGTLQPRKNLERVLEAHNRLPDEVRKIHPLVVVGREGWGVEELLLKLMEKQRKKEVYWLKYLPQHDVLALLKKAKALVFASLYEGFGLPVLEAFASRCPVIASNTTSLPEIAGDAAYLVDPLDIDAIKDALELIISDSNILYEKINLGVSQAQKYTWKTCAERTLDVYGRVIANYSSK